MVFNIDYNKKHQISILEWFLKDCVTLKTEAVVAITGINYILKYIQILSFNIHCLLFHIHIHCFLWMNEQDDFYIISFSKNSSL